MKHVCAIPNCKCPTLPGKLMCLTHWREVPLTLQFDVYRSWSTFKKTKKPNLQIAYLRAYRKARDAAIAHVTNQQRGEISA